MKAGTRCFSAWLAVALHLCSLMHLAASPELEIGQAQKALDLKKKRKKEKERKTFLKVKSSDLSMENDSLTLM